MCPRFGECDLPRLCPLSLRRWRLDYCTDDTEDGFRRCQRLRAARRGEEIPAGLLPNGFVFDVAAP